MPSLSTVVNDRERRDELVGPALIGLLSNTSFWPNGAPERDDEEQAWEAVAVMAYDIATAMVERRKYLLSQQRTVSESE